MHYLGLAGMPRRIMDYPVAYEWYNWISTAGSITSLISVAVFIWVFLDSMYCTNFNFLKAGRYVNAGIDLDTIHLVYFFRHYKNFFQKVINDFYDVDVYNLFFSIHKTFRVLANSWELTLAAIFPK